jgi:hypothetical protein
VSNTEGGHLEVALFGAMYDVARAGHEI